MVNIFKEDFFTNRSCLHFISSFSLLVGFALEPCFFGDSSFISSFSSFILLFRTLALSHFLDYRSLLPFPTFHLDTFSNILLNAMHKKYKCQFLKHFLKYIIECHRENKYKCQFLRHFLKYISLFNSEKNINVNSSDNLVLSVKFPLAINKFLDQYYNFLKQSTFKKFFNYEIHSTQTSP